MRARISLPVDRRSRERAAQSTVAVANPTLVILLSGALSVFVYYALFARLAFLPTLWRNPYVTTHSLDSSTGSARGTLIFGFAALAVLYYMAYRAAGALRGPRGWVLVTSLAVLMSVSLLYMYPFGADDIFDNIMHGRISAIYQDNPYVTPGRVFRSDHFLRYTAWPNDVSAYGPLWELPASLAARIAGQKIIPNVLAFKFLPGIFWGLTLMVAVVMLRRGRVRRALPLFLLLAWNPLLLYEVWGNGHNDMMMAFFILLSAWMMMERRYTLAMVALAAGIQVKYIPALLVPLAGLMALRALPDWKSRARFILTAGLASAALVALTWAPFWHGLETLTLERRAGMLSGTPGSALHSILVDGLGFDKEPTARAVTGLLAALTAGFAVWMAVRAARRPTWESYVQHSFYILMFYLLVTVPWFQQWYAIWPLVLLPFLDAPARRLALVFGFAVLGKQLWVDPALYWQKVWSPLPEREIAFALGNLIFPWLYAAWTLHKVGLFARLAALLPRDEPLHAMLPVTGEDSSEMQDSTRPATSRGIDAPKNQISGDG